jgi:signal transduction histidine kinase
MGQQGPSSGADVVDPCEAPLRSVLDTLVTSAAELLDDAEASQDDLADVLHDGAVQALVVARYAADAAVRGGDPVEARDAVQEALVAVRRHLWHLRPRGAASLVASLEQLSEQRVQAGGSPLRLVAQADLHGTAGVTAYRLVQAISLDPDSGTIRVGVRREGGVAVVALDSDVPGDLPLPAPDRWARRARALGGDLFFSTGCLRLVLPLTEARTAP